MSSEDEEVKFEDYKSEDLQDEEELHSGQQLMASSLPVQPSQSNNK
jgi:hypothetical protein